MANIRALGPTPYLDLGLPDFASERQINAAYGTMSLRSHVHLYDSDSPARMAMMDADDAMEILSDTRMRELYDA
jgi:DnaJ-class molecular chaperone